MRNKLLGPFILGVLSLIITINLGIYIEYLAILYGIDWLALFILMGVIISISFMEYIGFVNVLELEVHKDNLYELYKREISLYKREK